MQIFLYIFIVCLFSIEALSVQLELLPNETTYFTELASVIAIIAIAASLAKRRRMDIDGLTATILCFLLVTLIASTVINAVSPSVVIAGMRLHFKFLPFFVLPLVFEFSPKQIRQQMYLLLVLTVLQTPVALYQRFITYADVRSSDGIGGTLGPNSTGVLSVLLACAMCIIVASFLNGMLKKKTTIVLLVILTTPIMVNETKISFFLIPLALIIPVMFWPNNKGKIGKIAMAIGFVVAFFTVIIPVYDATRPSDRPIVGWFMSEDVRTYIYRGKTSGGGRGDVHRLDSVALAVRNLDHENAILLGLGIGNVSPSFSRQFEGRYYRRYSHFSPTRVHMAITLWETGIVGAVLYVLLIVNLIRISISLRSHEDVVIRSLALAWIGVPTMIIVTLVYFKFYSIDLLNCLFWFYSGYLVAEYTRQRNQASSVGDNFQAQAYSRLQ